MGCKKLCLSVALLPFLMICEHVRAQCTQPSFESRNAILSSSHLSSFPDGSSLTFECMIGHKPVNSRASKSVTCQGTKWTNLELDCKRKSCGSPMEFSNGKYNIGGILFGDKITAVCDKGYILDGQMKDRWCRDGGWDGRDPVCQVVKCEAPPTIENGQLEAEPSDSYDYSMGVSYRCNKGFSLIGKSELHCSEDGTFKPELPKCLDVCLKPEIPHAIRIGGKSPPYELGNFIEYKCENGYTMEGEGYIRCSENGWSPEPPKCNEETRPSTTIEKEETRPSTTIEKGSSNGDGDRNQDGGGTGVGLGLGLGVGFGLVAVAVVVGGIVYYKLFRSKQEPPFELVRKDRVL